MGAVAEKLKLFGSATDEAEVDAAKQYLRLAADVDEDDALVARLIAQAKDEADAYLNNDFLDEAIPATIESWVLRRVAQLYEHRVGGLASASDPGLGSVSFTAEPDYAQLDRYRLNPGI